MIPKARKVNVPNAFHILDTFSFILAVCFLTGTYIVKNCRNIEVIHKIPEEQKRVRDIMMVLRTLRNKRSSPTDGPPRTKHSQEGPVKHG